MSYDKNGEYITRAFFTFKPSAPKQQGNVFNNWSLLLTALLELPAGVQPVITFAESFATGPNNGIMDLREATLRSIFPASGAITFTVDDGTFLDNVKAVEDGLALVLMPTTPGNPDMIQFSLFSGPGVPKILICDNGGIIVNGGSQPAIQLSAGGGEFFVYACNLSANNAYAPNTSPIVNSNGANTILAIQSVSGGSGGIGPNAIAGIGTLLYGNGPDAPRLADQLQPGWTGTTVVNLDTWSSNIKFDEILFPASNSPIPALRLIHNAKPNADLPGDHLAVAAADGGDSVAGPAGDGGSIAVAGGVGGQASAFGNAGNGGDGSIGGSPGGDGTATTDAGNGGAARCVGGNSGIDGGTLNYKNGGPAYLKGGLGEGNGGNVEIAGGGGVNGLGGSVSIEGGDISGSGSGDVRIGVGPGTVYGGLVLGQTGKAWLSEGIQQSKARVHNIVMFSPTFAGDQYDMTVDDEYVVVDTTLGFACNVKLPANLTGRQVVVADAMGSAAANPITVLPFGGETVQGNPSYVIGVNREAITLILPPPPATGWIIV